LILPAIHRSLLRWMPAACTSERVSHCNKWLAVHVHGTTAKTMRPDFLSFPFSFFRVYMSTDLHFSPKKRKLIYIWSPDPFKTHPTRFAFLYVYIYIYTSLCIYIFIYVYICSCYKSLLTTIYFSRIYISGKALSTVGPSGPWYHVLEEALFLTFIVHASRNNSHSTFVKNASHTFTSFVRSTCICF